MMLILWISKDSAEACFEMVCFLSQNDGMGTDFLKNAITYSQTEGLGNDLWRMDDVSFSFSTV